MAEREGIIFMVILYLLIASVFCGLISEKEVNLLSDLDNSYFNTVNLDSNTSLSNIDFTVQKYNCDYTIDASGLYMTNEQDNSYLVFKFPTVSGESKGYYEYSIVKNTNDKLAFQFYDTALSTIPSFMVIENNKVYNTISTTTLYESPIFEGVGNTFTFKSEFDEDINIWNYYINDNLIYSYQPSLFPLLDLFSNTKNTLVLYDSSTKITGFTQSETDIKSTFSVLDDITRYTTALLKVLFWNLDGLPWWINLIFIKFPGFMLGMYVVLAAKGG